MHIYVYIPSPLPYVPDQITSLYVATLCQFDITLFDTSMHGQFELVAPRHPIDGFSCLVDKRTYNRLTSGALSQYKNPWLVVWNIFHHFSTYWE